MTGFYWTLQEVRKRRKSAIPEIQLRFVVAASGVIVAITNLQIPGDILFMFIMMDFSLAIQGFQVTHFTKFSNFYWCELLWALFDLPSLSWSTITTCSASSKTMAFKHFWPGPSIKNTFYIVTWYLCVGVYKTSKKKVLWNTCPYYWWCALFSIDCIASYLFCCVSIFKN